MNRAVGRGARATGSDLPTFSPRLYRFFVFYLQRFFSKNFTAIRTSRSGTRLSTIDGPLIVYANHPSWWDPIHFGLLNHYEGDGREIYGPMDADMLQKYGMFRRLGVFPTNRGPRGAVRFLRASRAILARPRAGLWITAEGHFGDPRRRPVRLLPGLARVASETPSVTIVPLALEYAFWNEKLPECLSRFGAPIRVADHPDLDAAGWTALLEGRLTETMDALADEATSRDDARFRTLLAGRSGVGGLYDQWRRLRAAFRGERFEAAHGTRGEGKTP